MTVEAESSMVVYDRKVFTLESEIKDCRSQLDAKATEKNDADATTKRKIAGLKLLLIISRSLVARQTAEKNACKSELQQCRAAAEAKTAEVDALEADQAFETSSQVSETSAHLSETSTQVSEIQPSQNDNVNDVQSDRKNSTSWADDFDDGTSNDNTSMSNSADEAQPTYNTLDHNSASFSQCDTGSPAVVDFARSTVDIFEDSVPSICTATVSLGSLPISKVDKCDDGILSNSTGMSNSAHGAQATGYMLNRNSGALSQCEAASDDVFDFARFANDIFEDSGLSGCKAIVKLGSQGVMAGMEKANGKHNARSRDFAILSR